jgi:hypothetical protein
MNRANENSNPQAFTLNSRLVFFPIPHSNFEFGANGREAYAEGRRPASRIEYALGRDSGPG